MCWLYIYIYIQFFCFHFNFCLFVLLFVVFLSGDGFVDAEHRWRESGTELARVDTRWRWRAIAIEWRRAHEGSPHFS